MASCFSIVAEGPYLKKSHNYGFHFIHMNCYMHFMALTYFLNVHFVTRGNT